ncbi:class I SAM-dependent methyltransferase [Microvirga sp. CF3062]|uniref:class I SAM-dependent methyltransferase n=1 Tax=Microvirga sp. CF3062 TaxID=3110182 RepID=UPI002E769B04|nr:class I SAM-dependent methyltransferase [Microvirga sp. CF3062]MEE1657659.1 class I SAM-dependent methyltransferase [Microvirga sp. CF3062]
MMDHILVALLKAVCRLLPGDDHPDRSDYAPYFGSGLASSARFFERLGGVERLKDARVLDIGCGFGETCVYAVEQGAIKAVGLDSDGERIDFARSYIKKCYPDIADQVELYIADTSQPVENQRFDLILFKDSFEHIAEPEKALAEIVKLLAPGGAVAIGNPPWKSVYGGHTNFMTSLPWLHLIFPERVVMKVRLSYRPDDPATCYEEVRGGMNRMTVAKFKNIMAATGLHEEFFALNQGTRPVHRVLRLLSKLPFGREIFAANMYGVWRANEEVRSSSRDAVSRVEGVTLTEVE